MEILLLQKYSMVLVVVGDLKKDARLETEAA
jgi:hypothetical protein